LPATRSVFWTTLAGDESQELAHVSEAITMVMPTSFRNHRKRPLTSDPFTQPIPVLVPPVDEEKEGLILRALIKELNDIYGLNLDPNPDTGRLADPTHQHDLNRTVLIGASHMTRIKGELEAAGFTVHGHCIPGWTPTKESANEIAKFCTSLKVGAGDLVAIDVWANICVMGTDENGLPCRAMKTSGDGRYHLPGELQAAPRTCLNAILKDMHPVLDAAAGATVVLLAPIPRYVDVGCCSDPAHITNRGTQDLKTELVKVADTAAAVAGSDPKAADLKFMRISSVFLNSSSDPSEWRTASGQRVWHDAVHLTAEAYQMIGTAIMAVGEEEDSSKAKRRRLESVVPAAAGNNISRRGTVQLPAWVSGQAARGERGSWRGRGRGARTGDSRGRGGTARGGFWNRGGFGSSGRCMRGRGRGF
jgi:hypothetical protein